LIGGTAIISNRINNEFYTERKPVKNVVYLCQTMRFVKIFFCQNFKTPKNLWILAMTKCCHTKDIPNWIYYKSPECGGAMFAPTAVSTKKT